MDKSQYSVKWVVHECYSKPAFVYFICGTISNKFDLCLYSILKLTPPPWYNPLQFSVLPYLSNSLFLKNLDVITISLIPSSAQRDLVRRNPPAFKELFVCYSEQYEHQFLGDNINAELAEEQREEIIGDLWSRRGNHDLKSFENPCQVDSGVSMTATEQYTVYNIHFVIRRALFNKELSRDRTIKHNDRT